LVRDADSDLAVVLTSLASSRSVDAARASDTLAGVAWISILADVVVNGADTASGRNTRVEGASMAILAVLRASTAITSSWVTNGVEAVIS